MADDKKAKGAGATPGEPKAKSPKPEKGGAPGKGARAGKSGKGAAGAPQAGPVVQERPHGPAEKPRLARHYVERVRPALVEKFKYKSTMQAPHIEKIVINMGVGDATQNAKLMDPAVNELGQIAGQKPVVTKAKKSIAAFKVREGMAIGAMVTLRGEKMYEFLDRFISVTLPRVRDFKGVSTKSFDGRGNYTMGLKDQLIFPEIDYAKVDKMKGMNLTIVTTAKSDNEARALLKGLGMPFRAQ